MRNIFIALMAITLAFALFDPNFFVAHLVSIAFTMWHSAGEGTGGGLLDTAGLVGLVMLVVAFVFVWRSFYAMRIPERGAAR